MREKTPTCLIFRAHCNTTETLTHAKQETKRHVRKAGAAH